MIKGIGGRWWVVLDEYMVEAGGVEPPSADSQPSALHV